MRTISILLLSVALISISARPIYNTYDQQDDFDLSENNQAYYHSNDQVFGPPGSPGDNPVDRVNLLLRRFDSRLEQLRRAVTYGDTFMVYSQYLVIPRLLTRIQNRLNEVVDDDRVKSHLQQSLERARQVWAEERRKFHGHFSMLPFGIGVPYVEPGKGNVDNVDKEQRKAEKQERKHEKKQRNQEEKEEAKRLKKEEKKFIKQEEKRRMKEEKKQGKKALQWWVGEREGGEEDVLVLLARNISGDTSANVSPWIESNFLLPLPPSDTPYSHFTALF